MCVRWGYMYVWTAAVFNAHDLFTFSTLLPQPMNTVSVVGNRTKIECSRNPHAFPVDWEFASAGSSNFSFIYTSKRITEHLSTRYKIDTDNRTRYDVVIDSVDLSHAGTYRCTPITENVKNKSSFTAQLIVLTPDPVCETNATALNGSIVEGDYIRMWCTVNYTGNGLPVIEWIRGSRQAVDTGIICTNAPANVTSSLTTQLNSSNNGVTFTCKMSFKPTSTKNSPLETFANNVPHYQHWWSFKLSVLYAPRNLTVTPQKCVYEVADHLVCLAEGNPTPTYEWIEIETNRTIPGSVLTIDDHMTSDKNHSFRCTAYNTVASIKRQIDETVTFTVRVVGKSQIATENYIIISIIAIGAVCCLVLTLYLCNNRCPNKRGISHPEPDILQALQMNHYESSEYQPAVPPRAEHSVVAEGGNLQQQLPLPIYAEVQRKDNKALPDRTGRQPFQPLSPVYSLVKRETRDYEPSSADGSATGYLPKHQGLPAYTEVAKNRNGSTNSDGLRQTVDATATHYRLPPMTVTGADGTQYVDVASIRDLNARAPIRHLPMISQVDTYASIDHTVVAPPPLPPKRQ